MKQAVAMLLCFGILSSACAHGGPAPTASSTPDVEPKPHVAASAAVGKAPSNEQGERLAILAQERNKTTARLTEAINSHVLAKDKAESLQGIARLQGDLQALDAEIARVQKEPPLVLKWPTPTPAKKASASMATPPVSPPASQEIEGTKTAFESWDVFKNFGQKGTQP